MKRPEDCGNGDSREREIESKRFQANLFHCFAALSMDLRQKSAQRLEPLAADGFTCGIAHQQTQIRLQAPIDRVVKGKSHRRGRHGSPGHTALKLALLLSNDR